MRTKLLKNIKKYKIGGKLEDNLLAVFNDTTMDEFIEKMLKLHDDAHAVNRTLSWRSGFDFYIDMYRKTFVIQDKMFKLKCKTEKDILENKKMALVHYELKINYYLALKYSYYHMYAHPDYFAAGFDEKIKELLGLTSEDFISEEIYSDMPKHMFEGYKNYVTRPYVTNEAAAEKVKAYRDYEKEYNPEYANSKDNEIYSDIVFDRLNESLCIRDGFSDLISKIIIENLDDDKATMEKILELRKDLLEVYKNINIYYLNIYKQHNFDYEDIKNYSQNNLLPGKPAHYMFDELDKWYYDILCSKWGYTGTFDEFQNVTKPSLYKKEFNDELLGDKAHYYSRYIPLIYAHVLDPKEELDFWNGGYKQYC